jgi:hypothetical protein
MDEGGLRVSRIEWMWITTLSVSFCAISRMGLIRPVAERNGETARRVQWRERAVAEMF